METSKRKLFVIVLTAVLIIPLLAASSGSAEDKKQEPSDVPVLVELYLVQVKTDALYAAGVAKIPRNLSQQVSIEKLEKCLANTESGGVLAATRVVTRNSHETHSAIEEQKTKASVGNVSGGKPRRGSTRYNFESSYELWPRYYKGNMINVYIDSFRYEGRRFDFELQSKDEKQTDSPGVSYLLEDADCKITLGEPTIVAAMQSADTRVFLIVKADLLANPEEI